MESRFRSYDQDFRSLVANSTCSINLHTYLLLELRRAIQMWFPLTASFGWPVTTPNLKAELIKAAHEIAIGNESTKEKLLPLILENFFPITIRAFANLYWILLLVSFVLAALIYLRRQNTNVFLTQLTFFVLLVIIFKILLNSFLVKISFEPRLLTPLFPFFEFLILNVLIERYGQYRSSSIAKPLSSKLEQNH